MDIEERYHKENILNYTPHIHFGSSLDNVSAHAFLNFMYNIQERDSEYAWDNLNF